MVEARVLARCCFENKFWIAELQARGDAFVKEMHDDESKSRKARGEFILSEGFRLDEQVEQRLRAQLRTIKKRSPQARFLNPRDVAQGGPMAQAYLFYSQLSSDAAHPTMASLNRYIGRFEEDGETVRGFDCDPPVKEVEIAETMDWACLAVIGACVGVNQILEGTPAGPCRLHDTSWVADDATPTGTPLALSKEDDAPNKEGRPRLACVAPCFPQPQ